MFGTTSDPGHRGMLHVLQLTGKIPRRIDSDGSQHTAGDGGVDRGPSHHRRSCDRARGLWTGTLPPRPSASAAAIGQRSVIETPFGRVEYAQAGDGPPVLVVHGVLGECDFGVGVGRVNVPPAFRVISPSRFGYLGSSFPPDPSPAAQADAFAALLDHLEIARLPVVRSRRGARRECNSPLRHAERVSRLVLISPNAPHPEPLPKPPRVLAPIIFSQPMFWAMRLLASRRLQSMMGTPAGFVVDEREHAALQEIVDSPFPVGLRAPGTIYDAYIGNLDITSCRFDAMTVPTLVVHAEDDTLSPYQDSRAMAERMPSARFVTVRRGGHALTQLDAGARQAVEQLLTAAGADATNRDPPVLASEP